MGIGTLPEAGYVGSHGYGNWDLVDSRLSIKALALEIQPRPVGVVGSQGHSKYSLNQLLDLKPFGHLGFNAEIFICFLPLTQVMVVILDLESLLLALT